MVDFIMATELAIRYNNLADTETEQLRLKVSAALTSSKAIFQPQHPRKEASGITTNKLGHPYLASWKMHSGAKQSSLSCQGDQATHRHGHL